MISLGEAEFYKNCGTFRTLASEAGPGGLIMACLEQHTRAEQTTKSSPTAARESTSVFAEDIKDEEGMLAGDADECTQLPVELSIWSTSSGLRPLGNITLMSNIKHVLNIDRSASVLKWNPTGKTICVVVSGEVILVDLSWTSQKGGSLSYTSVALRDDEDEEEIAQFFSCLLRIRLRKALAASSIWLCNNGSHLLIGSDRGLVTRINWEGEIVSRVAIPNDHSLLRAWYPLDLPLIFPGSTVGISEHFDIQFMTPQKHKSRLFRGGKGYASDGAAGMLASDHDDYEATLGDIPYVCGWSDRLRLGACHMADGSIMFLHFNRDGLQVSNRAVPVIRNKNAKPGKPETAEIVSKISTARVVDSVSANDCNSCMLVAVIISKHYSDLESPQSNASFRISASMLAITVTLAKIDSTLEQMSLSLSVRAEAEVFSDIGDKGGHLYGKIFIDLIHLEHETFALLGKGMEITCRSLKDLNVILFSVNLSDIRIPNPALQSSSNDSIFSLQTITCSLGRLFVNGKIEYEDAGSSKGTIGISLSFPLIVRLASPLLPQAERVFLEISNKVLHIYEVTDDVRSAEGSFDTVVLPKRLYKEFFSRHLATDKIFSSTASRLIQDGLLVGIRSEPGLTSRGRYLLCSASLDAQATMRTQSVERKGKSEVHEKGPGAFLPSFWLLNRYTLKWRSLKANPHPSELDIVDVEGGIVSDGSRLSAREENATTSDLSKYVSFWAALGIGSGSSSASPKAPTNYGTLRSLQGLVLFGEHSLIALGSRRARYFVDIMSREPLPESSVQPGGMGIPSPKVHVFFPLPPGFRPVFFDIIELNVLDRSPNDLNCTEMFCYICVGDGTNFFTYKIISRQSKPSPISTFTPTSYFCQQVWDIDVSRDSDALIYKFVGVLKASPTPNSKSIFTPLKSPESPTNRPLDVSTSGAQSFITLFQPFRKTILLVHPYNETYGLALLVLDAVGNCYLFTKTSNPDDSKPFDIAKVYAGCFDVFRSSNLCTAIRCGESSVALDPFSISVLFVKSLYQPYTSSGSKDCDALFFPFLPDQQLILCHPVAVLAKNLLVFNFICSSGLISMIKPCERRPTLTTMTHRGLYLSLSESMNVVSVFMFIFDAVVALDKARVITKKSLSGKSRFIDDEDHVAKEIANGTNEISGRLCSAKSLFNEIRKQPKLLGLVIDSFELRLKSMAERTNTFYRTYDYALIISSLFNSDSLMTLEVLGRLGRKLEPSVSKRLFPLPNIVAADTSYSPSPWSVLSMYELALSVGLLGQAGKFLTLCCSSDILGGLDSRPGAVRALVISLELFYQSIRRMSLKSALEVLQFVFRLEEMLGCHVDELLGPIDFSETISGFTGSLLVADTTLIGDDIGSMILGSDRVVETDNEEKLIAEAAGDAMSPLTSSIHALETPSSNASIGSIISAPARSFGIYSGAVLESVSGQIMSVSPALSYLLGGGLVWSFTKTAEVVSSPLSSIDSLQNQNAYPLPGSSSGSSGAGGGKKQEYFGGNEWSGQQGRDFYRIKGPISLRGPVKLRGSVGKITGRRGVIVTMPFSTGYAWNAYSFMDGVYGPLGVERLFQRRIFSVAFMSHMMLDLARKGHYSSLAVIGMTTLPISLESRSAFFRILCNIEDSATAADENETDKCESVIKTLNGVIRSLQIESLTIPQLFSRLLHPVPAGRLQTLVSKEFIVSDQSTVNAVSHFASHVVELSSSDFSVNEAIRQKQTELFEYLDGMSALDLQLPESVGHATLHKLIVGVFSCLLITDRRDTAAVLAAALLHRLDISCLCLKPTTLTQDECMRLLEFCSNIPLRGSLGEIDGTGGIALRLQKVFSTSLGNKALVNVDYLKTVCAACGIK